MPSDIYESLQQTLVRGQREELGEVLGERDLLEERPRLLHHSLGRQLRDDLRHDPLDVGPRHALVAHPLPDLRAGDLGGRSVLHQVVDRRRADAGEPRRDVADPDRDVRAHALLGDLARRRDDVQQVGGLGGDVLAPSVELVRLLAERRVEDLLRHGNEIRMRDPGAVESVARLSHLVLANLRQRDLVHLGITPARDERGHAADRVRAARVARADEELGVRAHERHGHRDLRGDPGARTPLGRETS